MGNQTYVEFGRLNSIQTLFDPLFHLQDPVNEHHYHIPRQAQLTSLFPVYTFQSTDGIRFRSGFRDLGTGRGGVDRIEVYSCFSVSTSLARVPSN